MSPAPTKSTLGRRALFVACAAAVLAMGLPLSAMALAPKGSQPRPTASSAWHESALHGRGAVFEGKRPRRRPPKPPGPFALCPVDRPRHYVDSFGDARYVGGYHTHKGIDIMAPFDTPIRAPFDGRAKSSSSWAGGLQVYLYGKAGFAFNAHLTRVGRMGKVKAGTIIGYVGNTGDARGGSPHDHFEWHPGGGSAVNPYELLNRVCRPQRRN